MADVPLLVISDNSSSERRITPSWTISQLRTKLEPVTGIPPSAQRMTYRAPGRDAVPVEAHDEDATFMSSFGLVPYAELHVSLGLGAFENIRPWVTGAYISSLCL